jgi:hypothetical protein
MEGRHLHGFRVGQGCIERSHRDPVMTLRLMLPALLTVSAMASAHGLTLHGPVAMPGDRLPHAQLNNTYGCTGVNRS